jgi:hypothetical protein
MAMDVGDMNTNTALHLFLKDLDGMGRRHQRGQESRITRVANKGGFKLLHWIAADKKREGVVAPCFPSLFCSLFAMESFRRSTPCSAGSHGRRPSPSFSPVAAEGTCFYCAGG